MRGLRRVSIWLMCVALMAASGLCAARGTAIESVRVSDNAARTRVVINLSGTAQYKLFQLSNPDRVVLDFSDSELGRNFDAPHDVGVLKDIRTGRHGKHGVRVVLDLAGSTHPKSFQLAPGDGHGHRLVVDLYGKGSAALANRSERQAATHAAELLGGARKIIVAVDAGHGGTDPGAHGRHGTKEKDITLKVAKDLAALIDKQPGMTAVLTRKGDYYVPLKRRYQIARKHNADVFVSIHADAFKSSDAKGSSVWVLSTHGKVSEAARWLADRQNSSDLIGGASLDDMDDTLASVLLDMQQKYAIGASSKIANNVLQALAKLGPTHRDHIERANFVVLRSPDVPSILVETAFITNPVGERKLRNPAYQKKLARAILGGVKKYFETTPPQGTWFALQARKRRGELAKPVVMARMNAADNDDVSDVYKVGRGDTLSSIAHQYGVSVSALKTANNMRGDLIRAGMVLAIPAS